MLLAIAALLIQPAFIFHNSATAESQISPSAETIAATQPVDDGVPGSSSSPAEVAALPDAPSPRAVLVQPSADADSSIPASAPEAAPASAPAAITLPNPYRNMTVSVDQLKAEDRNKGRIWLGLTVASHAAAGFDAWSTRHAITTTGGQELNPLLKPFAGNASIYAAIQAGPALMDYVGKKMMYSRHGWARRMWWVPQSASFVSSLFCGAHNLGVGSPN